MNIEYIYLFSSDLFERDEAQKWVHNEDYANKLANVLSDGKVVKYTIRNFIKACNNRDISDIWEYWFVRKTEKKGEPA